MVHVQLRSGKVYQERHMPDTRISNEAYKASSRDWRG